MIRIDWITEFEEKIYILFRKKKNKNSLTTSHNLDLHNLRILK